jgi:pilus assembly protein CpaC
MNTQSFTRRQSFARPVLAGMALAATFVACAPQTAWPDDKGLANSYVLAPGEAKKSLQLGVGRSVIVDLPEDATEIFIGDPKVANAVVRSARRLYVAALANGQTTIFALAADGRKIAAIDVSVGRDIGELQQLLNAALPGNDISVKTVGDSIILMGSVASAGDAQKALDIASGFIGTSVLGGTPASSAPAAGGAGAAGAQVTLTAAGTPITGKVINSLTIRGLDQVSLKVTISEIRRDIVKQLGVNMAGAGSGANAFEINNPFSVNATSPPSSGTIGWSIGGMKLSATLQAFERQGVARTIAEPTVTAVSGESAKFLAGGTIPISNGESCSAGVCLLSFIQQPYGVTLNFTPVVLSPNRIQLHIATEVTDIDSSQTIVVAETSIPGFRTRKNETTVELPSGGSIASAGLISDQTQQAIDGVPGLMNVPVIGALFRSRDYLHQQTELVIIVTPYIVHAIDPKDAVRPDANFNDSSDPQAWLLGRVNRIYSSSGALQPMPGYSGRVGFITD